MNKVIPVYHGMLAAQLSYLSTADIKAVLLVAAKAVKEREGWRTSADFCSELGISEDAVDLLETT